MFLDLTNKQILILDFIKDHFKSKNYPPTVREICVAVGLSSPSSVHAHLNKLEKLGYIKRDPDRPRAIEVLDRIPDCSGLNQEILLLPLLKSISVPKKTLFSEKNIKEYIPLPANLVKGSDNFILKVNSDSMIKSGIMNGDYVVVDKKSTASNSQIVIALINKKTLALMRFFKEGYKVKLQPDNEFIEPIFLDENEINIIGVVTGVFRVIK